MSEKIFKKSVGVLVLFLLVFLMSTTFKLDVFNDILSPWIAFLTAFFIWTGRKYPRRFETCWMLILGTAVTWGFADLAWVFVDRVTSVDPNESPLMIYLYIIPNIFLALSCCVYFYKNSYKWHKLKLFVDIAATGVILGMIFWNVVLVHYFGSTFDIHDTINIFSSFVTDFLILAILIVMLSSSKQTKISPTVRILMFGVVSYTFIDMVYVYSVFDNSYAPYSMIDYLYIFAIAVMGFASLTEAFKPTMHEVILEENLHGGMSGIVRNGAILIIPAFLFAVGLIDLSMVTDILLVCLIYLLISAYVQIAIKNEANFLKEKTISEELERMVFERTKELEKITRLDTLTSVYNRRTFMEIMDKIIKEGNVPFQLFCMDLDRFKAVNDAYGHTIGDRVLKIIADRLMNWLPEGTILGRLGGDEFVLICHNEITDQEILQRYRMLNSIVKEPIIVDHYKFHISFSMGVTRYPDDATTADDLLMFADLAMYSAKAMTHNEKCAIYHESLSNIVSRNHHLELMLRNLNYDEAFELHYQPQIELSTNKLVGMEALIRWKLVDGSYIPPSDFIPVAEESGLIVPISDWVFKTAVEQIATWNKRYDLNLKMGINISPKMLDSIHFISNIKKYLDDHLIKPEWVDIEITENSAMTHGPSMENVMISLSDLGLSISIDDFGTGYSSLSYIKRFDVDRLKIAKELIDNIIESDDELLIINAIIMMAKGMGLKTIAEGVETDSQLEVLRKIECDEVQGYIFSKPLPSDWFEKRYLEE